MGRKTIIRRGNDAIVAEQAISNCHPECPPVNRLHLAFGYDGISFNDYLSPEEAQELIFALGEFVMDAKGRVAWTR